MLFALCFSVGVMVSATVERLLLNSFVLLIFALITASTLACYVLFCRGSIIGKLFLLLVFGVAGFAYGNYSNQVALSKQLADKYDRQTFVVSGVVRELIVDTSTRKRFVFQLAPQQLENSSLLAGSRLLLNWYEPDAEISVGSYWSLKVRLKAPRGFVNPAGFDYQSWLLRRGFSATGTVKHAAAIGVYDGAKLSVSATLIDSARDDLRRWLSAQNIRHKGFFKALLIGDKSSIAASEWSLMRDTGTAHLMAISGLHIGLAAMLGCLFGASLGRVINCLYQPIGSLAIAHSCSALSAISYAAMAGFTTPTLRALVMVLTVQLCVVLHRVEHKRFAFSSALVVIAVIDPLAVWDAGFWLSFLAALVLILIFAGRYQKLQGGCDRAANGFLQALRSQWYLFFGLLIPLLLLMQRATLLAPVANIVAIPVVSLLVVPLLALSVLFRTLPGSWVQLISELLLRTADDVFSVLWQTLDAIQNLLGAEYIALGASDLGVWLCIAIAVIVLLLPRGVPGRCLSYPIVLMPFIFSQAKPADELVVTFMDVGQGTAVVVNVGEHWLVYDTGRRFSSKFDAGSGIISPYLDSAGVRAIDRLIVSHGDADHSGGAAALSKRHQVLQVFAPRELAACLNSGASTCLPQSWYSKPLPERIRAAQVLPCETPEFWHWGKTRFSLFSARSEVEHSGLAGRGHNPKSHARNNRSCLLLIEHQGRSVLLTGDVEAIAERSLLATGLLDGAVDWMSAPHHGSKTSSSFLFLDHLTPRNVVFQYGHNNSYHHPNKDVLQRYKLLDSNIEKTDVSGAVQLFIDGRGEQRVVRWRQAHRRFWY